ncbi:hypothetical protein BFJ72_g9726 [Fusarium proliferatum]|uniref:Uncharacterized protein n=1 Tax=Gibberella intermedia TaxID=948311 RepID=A0A420SXG0_GIBIN|nr:hypothetical protein BFJ72_g9726 [Fusarium proliferatum]
MAWSRSELSAAGFFYDEDLQSPVPPHVKTLRQSMLDFACQDQGPPSEECIQIQYLAKINSDGGYEEKSWENFFRQNFFDVLLKDTSVSQGVSRRVSRCNYYYDAARTGGDALWTTFREKVEGFRMKTLPKADLVFYLPMYHLAAESPIPRITDHRGREWNKEPALSLVESFSWSTLKELYMHGLRPSPFVQAFDNEEPLEAHLKCYPWLIVEFKRGGKALSDSQRLAQLETVRCQALNASVCAVKLNQIAARYAVELRKQAHIPPIPAVTTVGSKVSVWITYFAKDFMAYHNARSYRRQKQGYMMQRIWEGDMTEIRDIREFQLILENTYTWAMRVFKLQINGFIEYWRAAHCSIDSTPLRRSSRLREKAASQPGTPSGSQTTQATSAKVGEGSTAVLSQTRMSTKAPRFFKTPETPKTPKTPEAPESPETPKTPETPTARVGRVLALTRVIEISSGSESCEDSDAEDVEETEEAEEAEEAEDVPAYSPSSTCSTTFFTASEGRSIQGSIGLPSARSSGRLSTYSPMGPPPSIRSSMGPPSWRSIRPTASVSSRSQASIISSVDPLLDSANNDDWDYTPQQNVRKVFPDTCPRCQRTRKFFHNCHL